MKFIRNLIISILLLGGLGVGGWFYYDSLFIELPAVNKTIEQGEKISSLELTFVKVKKKDYVLSDYITDVGELNNKLARTQIEPNKPIIRSKIYDESGQDIVESSGNVEFSLLLNRIQTIDKSIRAGSYVYAIGISNKSDEDLLIWDAPILVTKTSDANDMVYVTFLASPEQAIDILAFNETVGDIYLLLTYSNTKLDIKEIRELINNNKVVSSGS